MYLPADKITISDKEVDEDGKGDKKGTTIKDLIEKGGGKKQKTEPVAKKFDEYTEEELDDIRENDRPTYVAVFKAHFGHEPEIED